MRTLWQIFYYPLEMHYFLQFSFTSAMGECAFFSAAYPLSPKDLVSHAPPRVFHPSSVDVAKWSDIRHPHRFRTVKRKRRSSMSALRDLLAANSVVCESYFNLKCFLPSSLIFP